MNDNAAPILSPNQIIRDLCNRRRNSDIRADDKELRELLESSHAAQREEIQRLKDALRERQLDLEQALRIGVSHMENAQRLTEERDASQVSARDSQRMLNELNSELGAELSALRAELEALKRDQDVLKLIERITGDDFCEDLDCRDGIDHELTGDLKTAARKLSAIYRHAHSALRGSSCHAEHNDWRKEADTAISHTAQPEEKR